MPPARRWRWWFTATLCISPVDYFQFWNIRGWETETALRQCENNVSLDRCQQTFINLGMFLYQKMTEDISTLNQLQEELKAADEVKQTKNISKIWPLIPSEIGVEYCSFSDRTTEDPGNFRKQSSWRAIAENQWQWVSVSIRCRKNISQEEDWWKWFRWRKYRANKRTWR